MAIIPEAPYAVLIAGAILLGLWLANFFYDAGIKHWMSRKIGHLAGSVAYILSAFLFSSWVWPVILSGGFTLLLLGARLVRPETFRGVGGTGRNSLAEVWYPLAGTIVLAVGWGWLNEPLVSMAVICFMGIGDAVTGIIRSQIVTKEQKHWSGSVGMVIVCLLLAWAFIHPFWIGVVGAVAATVTEYYCGNASRIKYLRWADDNLMIPLVSAALVFGLIEIVTS